MMYGDGLNGIGGFASLSTSGEIQDYGSVNLNLLSHPLFGSTHFRGQDGKPKLAVANQYYVEIHDDSNGLSYLLDVIGMRPSLYHPKDLDRDNDVDYDDVLELEKRATGPSILTDDEDKLKADFDGDNDIDQADFGLLQRCISGSGNSPDWGC